MEINIEAFGNGCAIVLCGLFAGMIISVIIKSLKAVSE